MTVLFQVPALFWRSLVSEVLSVAQTVFTNVCTPLSDEFVVIGDGQNLHHRVCTVETYLAKIYRVHQSSRR